ncbi:hypothetical protein [Myxococcus virescens]|uniref:Uncharacterized protein n=1 Tax=Myxococcus virescens TaxID=83456 RepID=A0A511HNQ1_9BACT|nr:hypothetical protein [Myxococcus virescens]GEL75211.1 hypothetical protein MVI01_69950 [Myxococcus virescens]SDD65335.1 hypothetical protein SAMN04488504_102136 [Myxococcus virescens]
MADETVIGAVPEGQDVDTLENARSLILGAAEGRFALVEHKGVVYRVRELTMAETQACKQAARDVVRTADGKPAKHPQTGQPLTEMNDAKLNALLIVASTTHAKTGKPVFAKADVPLLMKLPSGKGSIVERLISASVDLLRGDEAAVAEALEEELGNSEATDSSSSS